MEQVKGGVIMGEDEVGKGQEERCGSTSGQEFLLGEEAMSVQDVGV